MSKINIVLNNIWLQFIRVWFREQVSTKCRRLLWSRVPVRSGTDPKTIRASVSCLLKWTSIPYDCCNACTGKWSRHTYKQTIICLTPSRLRAYPGNQENSVEGRPIRAIFVVLPKVIISWTQPEGLTYVPCGPLIDITITSSLWQIFVLHSAQHKYEYFCNKLSSQRSLWIEQFMVKSWHLWLSSRGRLAATQYENSHGFSGAWFVWIWLSDESLYEHQFFRWILILSINR